MKAFLVAGTRSGCGKTSLTLGLLAALARQGLDLRPFKSGPDYIDPAHHRLACGRTSHNLDLWMCGEAAVRDIFARETGEDAPAGPDRRVAVVEGAMGLFDGRDGESDQGSAAHLARVLGLPVLLVLDASSQARSALALATGFLHFDPDLAFAGVVLNQVASDSHEQLLRQAFATRPDIRLLGCLRRAPDLALPSRHLGLVMPGEDRGEQERIARLADWAEAGLDLPALLAALSARSGPADSRPAGPDPAGSGPAPEGTAPDPAPPSISAFPSPAPCGRVPSGRVIAVARDPAFCFLYAENLRLLRLAGARLAFFSPLADPRLPAGTQALYLPGGYPELHGPALSANVSLRSEIHDRCLDGLPTLAECGGFMYLCAALHDAQGREHPLCGVFGSVAALGTRLAGLGYREAATLAPGPLGPAGTTARGHEFHYARLAGDPGPDCLPALAVTGRSGPLPDQGLQRAETLGSWIHFHFASNPGLAPALARGRGAGAGSP